MLGATLEETTFTQELSRFLIRTSFSLGNFFPVSLMVSDFSCWIACSGHYFGSRSHLWKQRSALHLDLGVCGEKRAFCAEVQHPSDRAPDRRTVHQIVRVVANHICHIFVSYMIVTSYQIINSHLTNRPCRAPWWLQLTFTVLHCHGGAAGMDAATAEWEGGKLHWLCSEVHS